MSDNDPSRWNLRSSLLAFCTALRFLTLIPLSWKAEEDAQYFTRSLFFFPLVGMLIGLSAFLLGKFLLLLFPVPVVAAVLLAFLGFISGNLHLDGLSDAADGMLSSRPREEIFKIMKDSRVGAMGLVVVIFVLLIKVTSLASMDGETLCIALFFIPVFGRVSILFCMATLPYAREEGGLGKLFYSGMSQGVCLLGFLLLLVLLLVIAPEYTLLSFLIVLGVIGYFRWRCLAKLGGATGDTLGAACELAEMAAAVSFTIIF